MWGRSGLRSNKQDVCNVKKTSRHAETKNTASRQKTASENRREALLQFNILKVETLYRVVPKQLALKKQGIHLQMLVGVWLTIDLSQWWHCVCTDVMAWRLCEHSFMWGNQRQSPEWKRRAVSQAWTTNHLFYIWVHVQYVCVCWYVSKFNIKSLRYRKTVHHVKESQLSSQCSL